MSVVFYLHVFTQTCVQLSVIDSRLVTSVNLMVLLCRLSHLYSSGICIVRWPHSLLSPAL